MFKERNKIGESALPKNRIVTVKDKLPIVNKTLIYRAGKYLLMIYWALITVIYRTVDLFLDLYTANDFTAVLYYAAAVALPLAALTLYYMRKDVFGKWYTYLFSPLIAFGLYLACTYFNALNLDLIVSAAFKPVTEQVLPVKNINKVFAKKAGFIHTDVALTYKGQAVTFQGTRSSYFLLRDKKTLEGSIGRSYFGNYFITGIQVSTHERWFARWQYLKDWFHRYWWLLIGFPLLVYLSLLKDKFFPKPASKSKAATHPYRKFFNILLIIILSVFGLFMLVVLLAGLLL